MIKIYGLLLVMILVSCAPQKETTKEVIVTPGPIVEKPIPAPSLTEVQKVEALIAEKNLYRELLGQAPLVSGLVCTLHSSNNADLTATWPSAVATYVYKGVFNQPDRDTSVGTNILPESLRNVYTNNYRIRCQGQIVVVDSGYYLFKLSSDDGSMLYLDGALLINNNGNHGITLVQASKLLERGIHTFRIDYGQTGGGNQALILETSSGVIPAHVFYR